MSFNKKKWMLLAAAVVCVGIAALVMANAGDDSRSNTWAQTDARLGHQPVFQDAIEEVSLTLKPEGFQPREIRPQGRRFLLSVDNRSGIKELVFRLSRNNGAVLREIRVVGDGGDWSELFDLDQGSYRFSEVAHPAWSCTVVIQESQN